MTESLKITISDEGIKVDAEGFKNDMCLSELDEFMKYMELNGIKMEIEDQRRKSESYVTETGKKHLSTVGK